MAYQVLTATSVMMAFGFFIYASKTRKGKYSRSFLILMLLTTVFAAGSFFESLFGAINKILIWQNIYRIGYLLAILVLLILAIVCINKERLLPKKIMESLDEGVVIVNEFGGIMHKNAAADRLLKDIFGNIPDRTGKTVDSLFDAYPQWLTACEKMHAADFEICSVHSGRKKYYRIKVYAIYAMKGKNSKKCGTVSIVLDITDFKIYEKESLHIAELKNINLIETIKNTIADSAALSIIDNEGNLLYNNNLKHINHDHDIYKAIRGLENLKGVYFSADGHEIDYRDMPFFKVLRGENVSAFHLMMNEPKGEVHFSINGTPIFDDEGNLACAVFFTLDITEQVVYKKLVPTVEQLTVHNQLKDKLFTVVAHDIRDPIASLVSMMELLGGESEFYSEYREIFTAVREQVHNTYSMVENLLEWFKSQKESLVFSPLIWNLSKIAEEAVGVYRKKAEDKRIKIFNEIDEDLTVFADKDMLELVLRNLINNAIKFTGIGGFVSLKANQSGKCLIISVSDSGMGIAPERTKTLFKEAFSRSTLGTAGEKGTGMGLLICKEFVERNGGELWVESIPGRGSTFYFSSPSSDKSRMVGINRSH